MLNAEIGFRPMRESDLPWVVEQESLLHLAPWTQGNFLDSFQVGYYTRLMLLDGMPVAYAVMSSVLDEAHLFNISVCRDWQGQGVGMCFLRQLLEDMRQTGAAELFLEVRPSNAPALALYLKQGFEVMGRRKQYYPLHDGLREDAIIMRLAL